MGKLAKLKDLAGRAGRWLGLSAPAAGQARHTTALATDRFDAMTWDEIRDQAAALRDLIEDLGERHDYAADLVKDAFLAACKAAPELHDPADMDPSRMVNHQIIGALLARPEFSDLRRGTIGDQYASAMAVLTMADQLREMTEQARDAQQAADADAAAQQAAAQAGQAVQQAMDQAAEQADADGSVPDAAAVAAGQAIASAEQASEAAQQAAEAAREQRDALTGDLRAAARRAADYAGEEARDEAELMEAWGIGPGDLRRMPFDHRRRLAERLRGNRLGKFARLIGRFRMMAAGERARKVEHAPGELVGIELSDDLSRLIPSDLASLGIPAMRASFAARLAENRLFTYDTQGEEQTGQGPIIAVIDQSGSMDIKHTGGITREAWSKALALALLDQAQAGRRDLVVILFGSASELMVFRFPGHQAPPIGDVLDFVEFFFDGGTDFEAPLGLAADLLAAEYNEPGQRADVVFVSDGSARVSEEWMAGWQECKRQLGYRVFGISIALKVSAIMAALCDNVREIEDLAEPSMVGDIFRVV